VREIGGGCRYIRYRWNVYGLCYRIWKWTESMLKGYRVQGKEGLQIIGRVPLTESD
jgi:hypothetical protein